MPIVVTEKAFTEAIHAVVAERGADYIYPEDLKVIEQPEKENMKYCLYFDLDEPTKPLCIIGAALARLGITVEDIYSSNDAHPGTQNASAFNVMRYLNADYDLAQAAADAQWVQDRGKTWGEALDKFDYSMAISKSYKEG